MDALQVGLDDRARDEAVDVRCDGLEVTRVGRAVHDAGDDDGVGEKLVEHRDEDLVAGPLGARGGRRLGERALDLVTVTRSSSMDSRASETSRVADGFAGQNSRSSARAPSTEARSL